MTDVRAFFDPDMLAADLSLAGGLLATDDGLETAAIVSLFSDRRANADDPLPAGAADRRGWWGDALPPGGDDADRLGSRLWLLAREKQTAEVVARAREYAEEALAWMVEDGVASLVEVEAEIVRTGVLGLRVTLHRPAGDAVSFRFQQAWAALAGEQA